MILILFISSNNKLSEQLRRLKQEKARLFETDSDDLADRTRDLMDVLEDGPDFLDSLMRSCSMRLWKRSLWTATSACGSASEWTGTDGTD
ncbi:MAG: hypothetical protein V8T00_02720 [Oscillospiraceae bacterium]